MLVRTKFIQNHVSTSCCFVDAEEHIPVQNLGHLFPGVPTLLHRSFLGLLLRVDFLANSLELFLGTFVAARWSTMASLLLERLIDEHIKMPNLHYYFNSMDVSTWRICTHVKISYMEQAMVTLPPLFYTWFTKKQLRSKMPMPLLWTRVTVEITLLKLFG